MLPWLIGAAAVASTLVINHLEEQDEERILARNIYINKKKEERALSSGIYEVDSLTGRQFEEFLSIYFRKLGYDVTLTPQTQDYGADLILRKNRVKTIVQAKRSNKPVSIKAVQEVASAIKHYMADEAIVITNNRFTENAFDLADSNGVELWGREELINFIIRVKKI